MPFTTVFATENTGFSKLVEILSVPELLARVAESISTSAGELTREGTLPEGGKAESSNTKLSSYDESSNRV
jgi:hypothetical protein